MNLGVSVQISFLVALTGTLLLSFQNCSNAVDHGDGVQSQANKNMEMGGNGSGYDGKVYVARGTCGHSERAPKSVLEVSADGQQAVMLLEECQQIEPRSIPVDEIEVAGEDPNMLKFNGSTFISEDPAAGKGFTRRQSKDDRTWPKNSRSLASEQARKRNHTR